MVRIMMNIVIGKMNCKNGTDNNRMGRGIMMTISISKIKKITARRKNRRENGRRAFEEGLNPHSNGEANSRSLAIVLKGQDRKFKMAGRAGGMIMVMVMVAIVNIMIYVK